MSMKGVLFDICCQGGGFIFTSMSHVCSKTLTEDVCKDIGLQHCESVSSAHTHRSVHVHLVCQIFREGQDSIYPLQISPFLMGNYFQSGPQKDSIRGQSREGIERNEMIGLELQSHAVYVGAGKLDFQCGQQ